MTAAKGRYPCEIRKAFNGFVRRIQGTDTDFITHLFKASLYQYNQKRSKRIVGIFWNAEKCISAKNCQQVISTAIALANDEVKPAAVQLAVAEFFGGKGGTTDHSLKTMVLRNFFKTQDVDQKKITSNLIKEMSKELSEVLLSDKTLPFSFEPIW